MRLAASLALIDQPSPNHALQQTGQANDGFSCFSASSSGSRLLSFGASSSWGCWDLFAW